jgi:hypothetical protein
VTTSWAERDCLIWRGCVGAAGSDRPGDGHPGDEVLTVLDMP